MSSFLRRLFLICAYGLFFIYYSTSSYKLSITEYQKRNSNGQLEKRVVISAVIDSKKPSGVVSVRRNASEKIDKNDEDQGFPSFDSINKLSKVYYKANYAAELFLDFKTAYNRTYPNAAEESKRFDIFYHNLGMIQFLKQYEKGTAVYDITEFTDLTVDEFLKSHTGYNIKQKRERTRLPNVDVQDLPEKRDWRDFGAVTEVKNQGSCGSCWAFSTTGNIEGVWKLKKGSLVSLSEQQLVDCDKIDQGCSGGLMDDAYKEIERMGGLETEGEYPYKGSRSKSCRFNSTEVKVYINDSVSLPKDEKQIAKYVDENGPVAIAINASPLMFYTGGIAHPYRFFCNPHHLNHGVVIVGFGVEKQKPFWIIKNSWGARWGESGYFRLFRGQGVCGVDQDASSVIVK